jgi:hypothetical protein
MLQPATPTGKPAARRRTSRLLGLALVLLTLALALPASASAFISSGGTGGWSAQSSGTTAGLNAVAFIDATHGWAVGGAGTILATTNGGGSSLTPTRTPTGDPVLMWEVGNVYKVYNGGTSPTVTQGSAYFVTSVRTYHWNNASGAPAGQITLKASDGTVYGPWQATGIPGQGGVPNASWEARPQQIIPAGTYTVIDSDPSTWSQNSATNGKGMCSAYGIPSSTPTPPPTPTPTPTGGSGAVALSLTAYPLTVPYKGTVTLEGALTDAVSGALLPNRDVVWAWSQNDNLPREWFAGDDPASSSSGEYSLPINNIMSRTYFVLQFAGDGQYSEGQSNFVKVMARAKLTPPAVASRVRAGVLITSWGTLKPPHELNIGSGTKVYWERYLGGRWRPIVSGFATSYRNTSSSTKYSVRMQYVAGKWRVRAVHQDNDHAKTTSSWRTFTAY